MVSWYHFHNRYKNLRPQTEVGIDQFCKERVALWLSNVNSYIQAHDSGVPVYFLSSEKLLENPEPQLTSLCHWLDLPAYPEDISLAVDHMSFGKLRAREERDTVEQEEYFSAAASRGRAQMNSKVKR